MKFFARFIFVLLLPLHVYQQSAPKNGKYISCYPEGQLKEVGNYSNKEKTGTWYTYEITGKLKSFFTYKGNRLNGPYALFDVYGNMTREGLLENDYNTGVEYRYENGKLHKKLFWLLPCPEQTDSSDHRSFKRHFRETVYDLNTGVMRSEGYMLNDKRDSLWKWYDEAGKLRANENYRNGKRNGLAEKFYQNGKTSELVEFKDGVFHGLRIQLNEAGDTTELGRYKNNLRDGEFFSVEPLRIMDLSADEKSYKISGTYKEGKLNGKFILKYQDGTVAAEEDYENDRLIGVRKLYNEKGVLIFEANYDKKGKTGIEKKYFDSGNIKQTSNFLNGAIHGKQTTYFESGKIAEEAEFENGKVKKLLRYYENGKVREKVIYENGVIKTREQFDEKGKKIAVSGKVSVPAAQSKPDHAKLEVKVGNFEVNTDSVYSLTDEMPEYPGGAAAMYKYLSSKIELPEIYKEASISSKCYVRFVVSETGKVKDIQVVKSAGKEFDQNVVKAVESLADFRPGKHKGKAVNVMMSIPINIHWK